MFQKTLSITSKMYHFPKLGLYEKSNKQLLSQSIFYLAFYQQKFDRNTMFK